jgi:hypothetical protein
MLRMAARKKGTKFYRRIRALVTTVSGRHIALDGDVSGMPPRLRYIVSQLHAEKVVHVGAESLFDAQRHFRGERGPAMEKV